MEALLGNGADVQLKGGKTQEAALHIAARIDEAKEGLLFINVETFWDNLCYCQKCVMLRFYIAHISFSRTLNIQKKECNQLYNLY